MNPLLSMTRNALDTATKDTRAAAVLDAIRSDRWREPVAQLRAEFARVLAATADVKLAKKSAGPLKAQLPGVLWSGNFSVRRADALVAHSGLLCADLDGIGIQLDAVRARLLTSPHLFAVFTSPTGTGLKAVFRVAAAAAQHATSFAAVAAHARELCGVEIDRACRDVARLCFVSHDPDAFLNRDATELPPLVESTGPAAKTPAPAPPIRAAAAPKLEIRRAIASELLGEIGWTDDTRGFCACPGRAQHTNPDGPRDCRVHLDGAPSLHCLHNSCRAAVDAANHELRSRIGLAEGAASIGKPNTPLEIAEDAETPSLPTVDWRATSANSASSGTVFANQAAIFVLGGFLERYLDLARELYESADAFLLGAVLPCMAAGLERRVALNWQESLLLPNIFTVLIGPPSAGKSDAFKLPEQLVRDVLGTRFLLSHRMSRESLFDAYLKESNRLLLVDDANELFSLWKAPGYGEAFGNAFLRLFDCQPLSQDFRGDKSAEAEAPTSTGPTSTSIGLGVTFNFARLDGLPQRSGLERRLFRYVAEGLERFIPVPRAPDLAALNGLKARFARLRDMEARFVLGENILDQWTDYQRRNRVELANCGGDEGRAGRVRTAPTYALKFAMLFEAEQWLERGGIPPAEFSETCLAAGFRHVDEALRMTNALDLRAHRERINEQAERLIEKVRVLHPQWSWRRHRGSVFASRSEITSRFAHDGGRGASLISTEDLYLRIIPRLVERNEARLVERRGKFELYAFRLAPPDEHETRPFPEVCAACPPPVAAASPPRFQRDEPEVLHV
jgi:hypothetical protein